MADLVEVGTNSPPIDLTREGVYQDLINQGAEVVLFRKGIEENRGQIYIDGVTDVGVSIAGLPASSGSNAHFTVSLEEARRINAIREEIRGLPRN